MTIYNDVFGGANIYPSDVSYSSLVLTADVTLAWPEETSTSENLATRIMDISSAVAGLTITLPDATGAGVGQTILFNNVGATIIIIADAGGTQVAVPSSGTLWQIYLTDNSTIAGTWASLQYGTATSVANAAALAGPGIIAEGTRLAQSIPAFQFSSNRMLGTSSRATLFIWTGAAGTLTLPSPITVGSNWFVLLCNAGTGALVVDPAGAARIDGSAIKSYQPGDSSLIISDGTSYYTVGYGQEAEFAFDYTSVAVAGTGAYTLVGAELNRIAYNFTGILTGNREVVVPATVQQYWVTNSTTGAFTLTVKTAVGTGMEVVQGGSAILYSNGVNVVAADTSGISFPIAVAQGGTGATTVSSALINLGGGTIGMAVFAAATENDVWAILGNPPTITGGTF